MGKTIPSKGSTATDESSRPYSLMSGGPFNRLLCIARLAESTSGRVHPSAAWIVPAMIWLPLLVLSTLSHQDAGEVLPRSFQNDFEVHARFLLALPLLLVAEVMTERCMAPLLARLHARALVPKESLFLLAVALESARRRRESWLSELIILLLVYCFGVPFAFYRLSGAEVGNWYGSLTDAHPSLSWTGYWYVFISLPIFQFVLLRWYYRLSIWSGFLWRLCRIPLRLLPAHPDLCGGLGFMLVALRGFLPLAAAHGALLAGFMATRVLLFGEPILDFKGEALAMVAFVLLVMLGPMLAFSPQLRRARQSGLEEYGCLAADYVTQFQVVWLNVSGRTGRPLLGAADIQSLSDLGGSYNLVKAMRPVLVSKGEPIRFGLATLLPLSPLLLAAVPIDQIVTKLAGILF